jgi:hypothetical protein
MPICAGDSLLNLPFCINRQATNTGSTRVQNGGSVRGYQDRFALLADQVSPVMA